MADIKGFKGVRPRKELAEAIAELPYDVVNSKEARQIAGDNELNFYHIALPEVDFPENSDTSAEDIYLKGKENLNKFVENGHFQQEESDSLYLYSLVMNGRMQTGLVTCVHKDNYLKSEVKKHEHVLEEKMEDRRRHIDVLNAQTGLVFLFYKEDNDKKSLFDTVIEIEPEYDFTAKDGIRHIIRKVSDKDTINSFKDKFKDKILYIADGHHRAASAVKVAEDRKGESSNYKGDEEYNWFLSVIFPHDQLKIMPYNRVVKDLNGLSADEFLDKLSVNYDIKKTDQTTPPVSHNFCLYLDSNWYLIKPKFDIPQDPVNSIDAQILQDTVLDPVLGITSPTKDKRINFVGGIKGPEELKRLVDNNEYDLAFSLHPVSIEELIEVSDINELMPPKSTWFEPKLRSGLLLHLI